MSVPLKLKNTADFQKMSTTEENYLAYEAGLDLASLDSSSVGTLGTDLSGDNRTVGSFIDTSFDDAVGTTEAGNLLSTTSITTVIRQKAGQAAIHADSDYRVPIFHTDDNGTTPNKLSEMDSDNVNTLVDRINSRIYTSDYPGTYKLSTSAPSGDYVLNKANVMTDTRTDGHSLSYNIYKRTTMTPPTTVLPFAIKRSGGRTGTYQGIQRMTPRQVRKTFGVNSRNRTAASSNSVGTYKIFSATEGTPTANGLAGTWQAKGTATDTKNTLTGQDYTRTRSSNYSRLRTSTYSDTYTRTRESTYLRSRTCTRASTYTAYYTTTRSSNYSPSFVGNYVGDYTSNSTRTSTRSSTATLQFTRESSGSFIGNYSRLLSFVGDYSADYAGNYLGTPYGRNYSRTLYVSVDQETFYYTSWYSADFVGAYTGNYARTSTNTADYTRSSGVDYTGNYSRIGTYAGNFIGEFAGNFTRDSQRITSDQFSRTFVGNYTRNYTRVSSINYQRTRTGNFARNFAGNYTGNFTGNFQNTTADSGAFTGNYVGTTSVPYDASHTTSNTASGYYWKQGFDATLARITLYVYWAGQLVYYDDYELNIYEGGIYTAVPSQVTTASGVTYTRGTVYQYSNFNNLDTYYGVIQQASTTTATYIGNYAPATSGNLPGNYVGNYAAVFTGDYLGGGKSGDLTNYIGNYTGGDYTRQSIVESTRDSTRSSTRNRSSTYAGNFVGDYQRSFTGNYARAFTRSRSSTFTGASAFARDFTGNYLGNYTRNFSATYGGNYARNFAGNYIGNYARNFIGDYGRTFVGNYAGSKIGTGTENIETYTLYVRVA
jgi:hypothetical protein